MGLGLSFWTSESVNSGHGVSVERERDRQTDRQSDDDDDDDDGGGGGGDIDGTSLHKNNAMLCDVLLRFICILLPYSC